MGFLKNFKKSLTDIAGGLNAEWSKFTNTEFLEAAVAVAYLIGISDGDFDDDEKTMMVDMIKANEMLQSYNQSDITEAYAKIDKLYALAIPMGNINAMKVVEGITDSDQKQALLHFACLITLGDGSVDDCEVKRATEIAKTLGISYQSTFKEFGLTS